MQSLDPGFYYTRRDVWKFFRPQQEYPGGGNWTTGYVREGESLVIFANIGVPGRTGHDFPNSFDSAQQLMTWYGKPNAHSAQPTFRDLFEGGVTPQVFVRWDSSNPKFLYLGKPSIEAYADNTLLPDGTNTIEVLLRFNPNMDNEALPPEGVPVSGLEGNKLSVCVDIYERDPRLRYECLAAFGPVCQICSFDFEAFYGELGAGFCHVHHIRPLSEVDKPHDVNPLTDLIPVCANCHAMLHRRNPALKPDELREWLTSK